jgi:hypothetical protein
MAVGQPVVPVFGVAGHLVPVSCETTPISWILVLFVNNP